MDPTTRSRTRRIVGRIAATWSELDHAQRRMLEIQTGVTGLTVPRNRRTRAQEDR
jgi:hypothetical protein